MELQDLYKTIYEIYLKNLQFLEKYHPNIFKKVGILSQCIDNGEHVERYELQFENDKGCFNILDKQENKYIYDDNSYEYSDEITKKTDFTSENTFSLLQLNRTNDALSLNTIVRELNPIKEIINKDIDFKNRTYLKIYKYLFMGTGLGIHISSLIKKFQPNSILIVEPSIEIFRLSMFITDYEEIAKDRQLFLSIADQRQERVLKIKQFHGFQPYLNYVVKYNLFEEEYGNLLTDAFKVFTLDHAEVFSYKIQLVGIRRTIQRVNEEFKFLDLREIRKKDFFGDKKVLIIAAGPSAKKNIEYIQKHKNQFYIVAVSTVIPLLEEYDIKPDMVTVIDAHDIIAKFFESESIKEFLKDTIIILPTQVSGQVLKRIEKENIRMLQTYNMYDDLSPAFMLSNVGAYTVKLISLLKAYNIYILGADCAFDQETGLLHSSNKAKHKQVNVSKKEQFLKAKGNFVDEVYTTSELLRYKNDFELAVLMFKNDDKYNFNNCSDGAYLEGVSPLKLEDIEFTNNVENDVINHNLFEHFLIAKKNDFKDDLKHLEKLEKELKKYKKIKFKNREEFINEQINVLLNITNITKEMSNPIYSKIFMEFLEVSGIYLYFYANARGNHLYNTQSLNNINIKWTNIALDMLKELKECLV